MSKKDGFDGFQPPNQSSTQYSIGGPPKGNAQIPNYKNEFKKLQNEKPEAKPEQTQNPKTENLLSAFWCTIKKMFQ